jgi:G3E family GTPase
MDESLNLRPLIETTVIGGYLGSGKTTLLRHILENGVGERIAVLVNDFGEVAIDSSLIRSVTDDMIELSNGCVCCSLAGGFIEALVRLRDRPNPPPHLVIEASGVSDPGTLAELGHMPGFRRGATVVVVDAEQVRSQLTDRYLASTIRRSILAADLLICNKIDLVSPETLTDLRELLAEMTDAPIIETSHAKVPPAVLIGMLTFDDAEHGGAEHDGAEHDGAEQHEAEHDHLDRSTPTQARCGDGSAHRQHWVETLRFDQPIRREALEAFLSNLPLGVVRVKALLNLAGEPDPVIVQAVGRRWKITLSPEVEAGARPGRDTGASAMVVVSVAGPISPRETAVALGVD